MKREEWNQKRADIAARMYTVEGRELAGADIIAALDAMAGLRPWWSCVGARNGSHRRADRAVQALKRAGLVWYDRGLWRVVEVEP